MSLLQEGSMFATMLTHDFIDHLQSKGLKPTPEELNSVPVIATPLSEGIALTILQTPGQRGGWPAGETSVK